jgi:hypothetical protein
MIHLIVAILFESTMFISSDYTFTKAFQENYNYISIKLYGMQKKDKKNTHSNSKALLINTTFTAK